MLEDLKWKVELAQQIAGPASLEMFDPAIQGMDPYEVARKARIAIEPLIA